MRVATVGSACDHDRKCRVIFDGHPVQAICALDDEAEDGIADPAKLLSGLQLGHAEHIAAPLVDLSHAVTANFDFYVGNHTAIFGDGVVKVVSDGEFVELSAPRLSES